MIQIKINNKFVEMAENLSLALQQGNEEPSNITSRSFKHSYTISIENNSENRAVFGHYDPKKTGNFNQVRKNLIEIYSDGTLIFNGSARITEVTNNEIKFFCISEEADWVQDIQGNLKDLNFGTGYTFYGARPIGTGYPSNAVFVTDFWTGNTTQGITTNEVLQFPLISYGNFYVGEFKFGASPLPGGIFFTQQPNNIADSSIMRVNINYGATGYTNSALSSITTTQQFYFRRLTPNFFQLFDTFSNEQLHINSDLQYANDVANMSFVESYEFYDVGNSVYNNINKYSVLQELEMEDVPPSINLKKTLDTVFSNVGWKIQSSFLDSEKFKSLYMTYSGKKDPAWNWGTLANLSLSGSGQLVRNNPAEYYRFGNGLFSLNTYMINFMNQSDTVDYLGSYDNNRGFIVPKTGTYNFVNRISGTSQFIFSTTNTGSSGVPDQPDSINLIYLAKRINSGGVDEFELQDDGNGVINCLTATTGNQTANLQQNESIVFYCDANWFNMSGFPGNTTSPYQIPLNTNNFGTGVPNDFTLNSVTLRTIGSQTYVPLSGFFKYSYVLDVDFDIKLTKGEKLKYSTAMGGWNMSPSYLSTNSTGITLSTEIRYILNQDGTEPDTELLPQKMMPEMSQIDYVKSIINSFNLYSLTDSKNKSVYFEPRDTFIIPSQLSLDFTNKEFLEFKQTPLDLSKFYTFGWGEDTNDSWSEPIDINNGVQLWNSRGDGTFYKTIDQDNADGQYTVSSKIGFASERRYHSHVVGYGVSPSSTKINIPTMGKEDQFYTPQRNVNWTFDYMPKIVEWRGMKDGAFIFDEQVQPKYPYAASTNATGITLTWYDKNLFSFG